MSAVTATADSRAVGRGARSVEVRAADGRRAAQDGRHGAGIWLLLGVVAVTIAVIVGQVLATNADNTLSSLFVDSLEVPSTFRP